jgi:hypothetical protein
MPGESKLPPGFAENKIIHIGLSLSTLLSSAAFASVVLFWKNEAKARPVFSRA